MLPQLTNSPPTMGIRFTFFYWVTEVGLRHGIYKWYALYSCPWGLGKTIGTSLANQIFGWKSDVETRMRIKIQSLLVVGPIPWKPGLSCLLPGWLRENKKLTDRKEEEADSQKEVIMKEEVSFLPKVLACSPFLNSFIHYFWYPAVFLPLASMKCPWILE